VVRTLRTRAASRPCHLVAGCRWFARGGGRREKTVLAAKLYSDMGEWPNDGKLSALNIRRALDASLTRLQTDYIDLYQFHHVDRATPWDEIWPAIDVAVTAGKILYVGSSNFAGWHIAEAQEAARGSGAGRTLRAVSATRSGPHAPIAAGVDGQPAHLRGLAD